MRLNLHGFLAPLLGAVGGSLVSGLFGNASNKANIAAQQGAQNQAEAYNAEQLQKMIDFIKSQQTAAFGNLDSYLQKHPMPTANLPPIALPNFGGQPTSFGGQQIGDNGSVVGNPQAPQATGNTNANSMLLSALWPMLLAGMQQKAAPPPPASPTAPQNFPHPRLPIHNGFNGDLAARFALQ